VVVVVECDMTRELVILVSGGCGTLTDYGGGGLRLSSLPRSCIDLAGVGDGSSSQYTQKSVWVSISAHCMSSICITLENRWGQAMYIQ
jgi:hypothetical protein